MKSNEIDDEFEERLIQELSGEWSRMDKLVPPSMDLPPAAWEQRIQGVWMEKKRARKREDFLFLLIALTVIGGCLFVYSYPYVYAIIQGLGLAVAAGVIAVTVYSRKGRRYES
ncbi:YxlC family protein [Paenibacillus sp. FSL R5-0407]|uniref:YxlC family protein n=1 Tax=Paenibacillus sp. FSL R5-0407 TaxID=2975320 RepID=UPI0030F53B3F